MNYIDHIKGYLSRAALLLLMAGGALMAGCEDFLVRDVPNQTTDEEWWQNKGQLNTALNNLYKPMPSGTITYVNHDVKQSQASGYPNARVEMEALTDNGVGSANYVSYNAFTAGITSSSEDVCNKIWNMKWTVIRRCCRFMEHYQQATVAPDAAPHEGIQTVDRFAAEARALRAFYHLELFLFFGDIPLVDHSTLPTEQFLVRRPQQEVVDWIAGELEGASHNLPVVPQTKSERWRWTKGACYAWMSYLYLYVGDWANAKKWAEEVIKLGIYDLYRSTADPADSFRRQFIHEAYNNDTKEELEGAPASFETKDAIGKEGSTKTGYWIKKWANETDRTNYSSTDGGKLDFQNMRYAVVLLNYVEAAIELNQLSDPNIYDYLDDIRDRAGMPPVDRTKYATQTKLRELVRRERRVELAFEGHRLFDIRRWRVAEQVRNGEVYGATPPGADDRYLAQTRVFNPNRDYLWPIPVGEMNTNTAMEQNPGY